jgi:hypothetical protein
MLGGLLLCSAAVRAEDAGEDLKDACASSYEQAQTLRRAGKLTLARAQHVVCERTCPGSLSRDCRRWAVELAAEMPSVVVRAVDRSGRPVSPVELSIDGEIVELSPQSGPLPLDPGRHRLVLRSGEQRRTASILLAPREQMQLTIEFESRDPAPAQRPTVRDQETQVPSGAWALGAVGVVGLGAGAVLGIKGHVDRADLRERCAPACDPDEVEAIRRDWTIAAVAAGVGAVATGLAIWLVVDGQPRAQVGLRTTYNGPRLLLGGSF